MPIEIADIRELYLDIEFFEDTNKKYKPIKKHLEDLMNQAYDTGAYRLRESDSIGIKFRVQNTLNDILLEMVKTRKEFMKSSIYLNAVKAHVDNNIDELKQLIPHIFGELEFIESGIVLYHGIFPKPARLLHKTETVSFDLFISPKAYAKRIHKITKEGLKSSKRNFSSGSDENLRAVYTTPNPYFTHGPALFEINTGKIDAAVFKWVGDEEYLIFTPMLRVEMPLLVKPYYLVTVDTGEEAIYSRDIDTRSEGYVGKVMKEFKKIGLDFKLLEETR